MEAQTQTFVVDAAIAQYKAVMPRAVDFGCAVATANAVCFGIASVVTTAAGEEVPIVMFGETEALLGGTVAQGDRLKSDANGDLVAASSEGDNVVALALEDGVDNDVIRVFVMHMQIQYGLTTVIADPGDAAAIPVTKTGHVDIVTEDAETRTLAAPTYVGQELLISLHTDGGDAVITCATTINQTGNNTITMADEGDAVLLVAKANSTDIRWSVVVNDGAALSTA